MTAATIYKRKKVRGLIRDNYGNVVLDCIIRSDGVTISRCTTDYKIRKEAIIKCLEVMNQLEE